MKKHDVQILEDDSALWEYRWISRSRSSSRREKVSLKKIFSLKEEEKSKFVTPSSLAHYRLFLYLTKEDKKTFIDSLKDFPKEQLFNSLYLRKSFFRKEDVWSLEELHELSLLESTVLKDNLLTFDGKEDNQTLKKIALNKGTYFFCKFLLKKHKKIFWNLIFEKTRCLDYGDDSGLWDIVNLVLEHQVEGRFLLKKIFLMKENEKSKFITPNSSAHYRLFLYLTKEDRKSFVNSLKGFTKEKLFDALRLRREFYENEVWNFEELYELSLLESGLFNDDFFTFDGREDDKMLEKVTFNMMDVVMRKELEEFNHKLNSISPTLCLAKWYQTTLRLHNGQSSSCCLQEPKNLDLGSIEKNPSKLHNGEQHIYDRQRLLNGEKISECQVCWEVENQSAFSERLFKSSDHWAKPHMDRVKEEIDNAKPTYVEVAFSHKCQMRCCYCNSETSSSIENELQEYGPYPDRQTLKIISNEKNHAYTKAFWKWLPDIYKGLKVLRLTGGEPFLSEDTFRFLDYLQQHPNKEMDIEFNTNLSFHSTILHRFVETFKKIPRDHYREVTFFVSLDCWGKEAEYIRFGMKTSLIEANIEKLITLFDHINITITSTINALAVCSFFDLVVKVEKWKKQWGKKRIQLSSYPLIFPSFQSVELLGKYALFLLKETESHIYRSQFFSLREQLMVGNIRQRCEREIPLEKKHEYLEDFYRFFREYDRRKKTDFVKVFPSLKSFFEEGQCLAQQKEVWWKKEILSSDPKTSFTAYQELIRVSPNTIRNQGILAQGTFSEKDIFQEDLRRFLSQSLVNSKKFRDVFYTLSLRNSLTGELKTCLVQSLDFLEEEQHHLFYTWQKLALEFQVPKDDWFDIIITLYKKIFQKDSSLLLEHFLSSLLFYSSPHLSFKKSLKKEEQIYSSWIFRDTIPSKKLLSKLFSSKFNIMAFNLDLFLKSFSPSKIVVRDIWDLAYKYHDKLDMLTKGLRTWKGSFKTLSRDLSQRDHFVNAQMISSLGIERWATECIGKMDDPVITSSLLTTWKECGILLHEETLVTLLIEKHRKNNSSYIWINSAINMVNEEIFWPLVWQAASKKLEEGILKLLEKTPLKFINGQISNFIKIFIQLPESDSGLWNMVNLVLNHQIETQSFLNKIFLLKEEQKSKFITPNPSAHYRLFLHLTKDNRKTFISSLKGFTKEKLFEAFCLHREFDGKEDNKTLEKIAFGDRCLAFCRFFLKEHTEIVWNLIFEKAQCSDFEDDSGLWNMVNLVLDNQIEGQYLLNKISSLKEEEQKSKFITPNPSAHYRLFLHLTKDNRKTFISSLKGFTKEKLFEAFCLRREFYENEVWSLEELYELSLLEPSLLKDDLLIFDGKEDNKTLEKIGFSENSYNFCKFFLENGYTDISINIIIMTLSIFPKDHPISWNIVDLVIKHNLEAERFMEIISTLNKPLKDKFLIPSNSATFKFFVYLKEKAKDILAEDFKDLSRDEYFKFISFRKAILIQMSYSHF